MALCDKMICFIDASVTLCDNMKRPIEASVTLYDNMIRPNDLSITRLNYVKIMGRTIWIFDFKMA